MNGSVTERTHLMEYGVVGVFIYEALTERASQGRRVPVPVLLAILATTLVGALDEGIQAILPSRVFDPLDVLFNFLAAVMAVTASAALRWGSAACLTAVPPPPDIETKPSSSNNLSNGLRGNPP